VTVSLPGAAGMGPDAGLPERRTMDDERERDASPQEGAEKRAAQRLGVNDAPQDVGPETRPSADPSGRGGPADDPPARTPGQA
jgi:hypothetical protein